MVKGSDNAVKKLKKLLLQAEPVYVEGVDFNAVNFGDEAQGYSEAGRNSLITSEFGSFIIVRKTGEWQNAEPFIRLTNVSHIPPSKFKKVETDLTFKDIRRSINGTP